MIANLHKVHSSKEEEPKYRILPHNQEAEQGLLGALLVDNRALEKVDDFILPGHFFMPVHQRIYEAIIRTVDQGQVASPVTLKGYFEKDEDLKTVGGAEYLADLAGSVVNVINAEDYGRLIYDLYIYCAASLCSIPSQSSLTLAIDKKNGYIIRTRSYCLLYI